MFILRENSQILKGPALENILLCTGVREQVSDELLKPLPPVTFLFIWSAINQVYFPSVECSA